MTGIRARDGHDTPHLCVAQFRNVHSLLAAMGSTTTHYYLCLVLLVMLGGMDRGKIGW